MIGAALLAVRIGVLGIFAPTHVMLVAGAANHDARLDGERLIVDGHEAPELRVSGAPLVEVRVLGQRGEVRIARKYRGAIAVRVVGGALQLVDEIAESEYLPGTVALESQGQTPAALEAQAVLARSYLRHGARHAAVGYDLCDLTHCQTYRGVDGETEAARRAVAATDGEVLTFEGRVADVYFTAACGGATADGADVWPGERRPYLSSVPCDACRRSSSVAWRAELALADVDRALGCGGRLRGLSVVERGAGGVVKRVRLDGDGRVVGGEELRIALGRALGWNQVRSNRFSVERAGDGRVVLAGRGAGHGVGLCELGAAELARAGLDHRAILRRYFPGAQITTTAPSASGTAP